MVSETADFIHYTSSHKRGNAAKYPPSSIASTMRYHLMFDEFITLPERHFHLRGGPLRVNNSLAA